MIRIRDSDGSQAALIFKKNTSMSQPCKGGKGGQQSVTYSIINTFYQIIASKRQVLREW